MTGAIVARNDEAGKYSEAETSVAFVIQSDSLKQKLYNKVHTWLSSGYPVADVRAFVTMFVEVIAAVVKITPVWLSGRTSVL